MLASITTHVDLDETDAALVAGAAVFETIDALLLITESTRSAFLTTLAEVREGAAFLAEQHTQIGVLRVFAFMLGMDRVVSIIDADYPKAATTDIHSDRLGQLKNVRTIDRLRVDQQLDLITFIALALGYRAAVVKLSNI